jgi:hypothetical protein
LCDCDASNKNSHYSLPTLAPQLPHYPSISNYKIEAATPSKMYLVCVVSIVTTLLSTL